MIWPKMLLLVVCPNSPARRKKSHKPNTYGRIAGSAELFLRESWEQTNGLDDAAIKEHNLQALHILGQIHVQVRLESSAAWWIDHSCGDGACLLRRVYREQHPKEIQV